MSSPLSSSPLPSPPSPAAARDIHAPPPQLPPFPSPLPPPDNATPPPQIAPFASPPATFPPPADLVPPISASPVAPVSSPPPIPTPSLESPPPVKLPTLPPPPPVAPAAPPPEAISTPVIPDPSPPSSPVAPIPSKLPPFPVVPSSPLLPPPGSISPSQPGVSSPPFQPSPSPYSSPPAEPAVPNFTPPAPFPFEQPVIPTPVKSPELPLPLTTVNLPVKSPHSHLSTGLIIGFTISGFFVLLVLGALLISFRSRRTRKRRNQDKAQDFTSKPQSQLKKGPNQGEQERANNALPIQGSYGDLGISSGTMSYDELVKATDGFSDANLIGEGGFGYVHKGVIRGGQEVAIKQLKEGSRQGEREFQAEVEIISRVHHKHLVSLIGYCISGARRLLVYEFVPNNTLEFHLHGNGQPVLAWPTRLKIAVGSAKGLAYLHEDCNPVIIHRDIKAANILLDHKFEAKVSDFGLAKSVCNARTRTTQSSTQVVGTFGYLAPEYATSGKVTEKSDVYSYGVMLLELITGRPPIGGFNASIREALVIWARPLLTRAIAEGNFEALVDPRLQSNYNASEMARMVACAAACVRHSSWLRPRMSQIARVLEGDISIGDLNEGASPGHSNLYGFGFPRSMNVSLDNSRNGIGRYSGTTRDISIGDLNEGASPGHSNLYGFGFPSSMNVSLDNSRNGIGRYSGTTSEYGLASSSNSSEEYNHR